MLTPTPFIRIPLPGILCSSKTSAAPFSVLTHQTKKVLSTESHTSLFHKAATYSRSRTCTTRTLSRHLSSYCITSRAFSKIKCKTSSFQMVQRAMHFTPKVLLSAPRRSAGIPNPSGTLVSYPHSLKERFSACLCLLWQPVLY